MGLISEPIFFESLRVGSGQAKRRLIHFNNGDDTDVIARITDIEKPEWVELEGLHPGVEIKVKRRGKLPVVANVNTNHRFFPQDQCRDQKVRVHLDNDTIVDISVAIPRIQPRYDDFRGVFAMDFGTTNSCYAWRGGAAERGQGASTMARASSEIPTLIFFRDVADSQNPSYTIGNEAEYDVRDYSGRTYSYVISVKRMLGQDRVLFIMDRLAGLGGAHQREYTSEEVAAFIVRRIIERAQENIGARLTNVVATYPPMFSQDRKDAIQAVYKQAFRDLGVELSREETTRQVKMELDEANAAAFNYVYGTMLDEFRRFRPGKRECQLLSFDFGGGTTDISLVDVGITQDPNTAKITIRTELKGLSGDANYGGDIVTLESFRMLKKRLALKIAELRQDELKQEEPEPAQESDGGDSGGGDDIWGSLGGDSGGDEDPFAALLGSSGEGEEDADPFAAIMSGKSEEQEEKKEEEPEEVEVDPELEGIEPQTGDDYLDALRTVLESQVIIEQTIQTRTPLLDATIASDKAAGKYVSREQSEEHAREIYDAVEKVVPTRFAVYRDTNPHMEDLARKLFHELWYQANNLKIQMAVSEQGEAQLRGTLKKLARYANVDPTQFTTLNFEIKHLDAQIEQDIVNNLRRAKELFDGAQAEQVGDTGLAIGGPGANGSKELRVLLFGNSSRLPIVRRKALEVFGIDEQNLVMDKDLLKSAVARGACEDHLLRSMFGDKGGLISYEAEGFLERLPYSVGLQNENLGLMGFERGYCPIFNRGTRAGKVKVLTQERFFLVHPEMNDLEIWADYCDGAEPQFLGWFDFLNPTPEEDIPESASQKDVEMLANRPDDAAAPEGGEQEAAGAEAGGMALGGGGLSLGGGGGGLSLGGDAAGSSGGGLSLGGEQPAETQSEVSTDEPAATEQGFRIEIELLPTRQLVATNPETGQRYLLKRDQSAIPCDRDPFCGMH